MPTVLFFPDADPETSTVDGSAARSSGGASWSTLRDATTASSVQDSTSNDFGPRIKLGSGGNFQQIWRAGFLFDTSSIGSGATITSAALSVQVTNIVNDLSLSIAVVSFAPASDTAIATGDYDAFGTTRYSSDVTIASLTDDQLNSWTLNATGLAAISKTGITKLALRMGADIDDSPPSGSDFEQSNIVIDYSEGTVKPRLSVTYTRAGGKMTLLGVS